MLRNTAEVIDALGGNQAVGAITDATPQAVSNWRSFKSFPAKTYVVLQTALSRLGKSAPPSLWGMIDPD